RLAQVIVPDYQLSLAIGKEGQNARLAHKLTGWKIDIHSDNPGGADPGARRAGREHDGGPGADRGTRPGGENADPRAGRGTTDAPARSAYVRNGQAVLARPAIRASGPDLCGMQGPRGQV